MKQAMLEHVNITVPDPVKSAEMLSELFGWQVRWQGDALAGGTTVHVGSDDCYIALYKPKTDLEKPANNYTMRGGLNHIGVVVDDLDLVEKRVRSAGYEPINHADYEPGRRFYFHDHDGVEIEVVSYQSSAN